MEKSYDVVVVTGASSGIGREFARQWARRGCSIGLVARRRELLEDLAEELRSEKNIKVVVADCDVTRLEDTKSAFARVEKELGPVDLLIANAGVSHPVSAHRFDAAKASAIYDVNLHGVLNCLEAVLPGMVERRSGHVVGISSLASYASFPGSHAYCGSKSALNAQLEGLRRELRPFGVRVTTLCPGFVATPMARRYRRETYRVKVPRPQLSIRGSSRRLSLWSDL